MKRAFFSKIIICSLLLLGGFLCAQESDVEEESMSSEAQVTSSTEGSDSILAQAYVMDDSRMLIAGDVIRFQVFEDEEPPVLVQINEQGYADFPYIGRIEVQGETAKSLAERLKEKLEKTFYYKATVFLAVEKENPIRGKITIVGEVGNQGPQSIPANTEYTLSKAILAAGGFTAYAKENKVRVIRDLPNGKQETFEVDVEHIYETGDRSEDVVLQPNDYVIVPKSAINF